MNTYKCINIPDKSYLELNKSYLLKFTYDYGSVNVKIFNENDQYNEIYSFTFKAVFVKDEFLKFFQTIDDWRENKLNEFIN